MISDDKDILHMTLQCMLEDIGRAKGREKEGEVITFFIYFLFILDLCCYSPFEYESIADIISVMPWEPMQVRFSKAICNFGGKKMEKREKRRAKMHTNGQGETKREEDS